MKGVNRFIGIGNLGRDPDSRYTASGAAVTTFSIAVSEQWKDKQSGEDKEKTEWINCVAFGRLAEIASEYLRKGSKVYVEGKLQTSTYEKDGQKHYKTDINVRELQFLDSKPQQAPQQQSQPLAAEFDENSVPF